MFKKVLVSLLVVAMTATMFVGCGSTEETTEAATEATTEATEDATEEVVEGEGKLYGITYWCESDFFSTIANSITEKAEADGSSTVIVDAQQDSAYQIQIIEDFIAQGVDAVFLNPVDKDAITPALMLLEEAGIPVINFDSGVEEQDMTAAFVGTDNYYAGVLCAEAMMADLPDGGEIAILNYPANSACNDREEGFLDTIEGSNFTVVATFDAEGTTEAGTTITSDLLQAYPDLVAVFCINDQAGLGAYASIVTAGMSTYVYGVDGNPDAKTIINADDTIYRMTAAQSPIQMGYESYEAALEIMAGEITEFVQIDVPAFTIDGSNVADYLEGWQ